MLAINPFFNFKLHENYKGNTPTCQHVNALHLATPSYIPATSHPREHYLPCILLCVPVLSSGSGARLETVIVRCVLALRLWSSLTYAYECYVLDAQLPSH